MGLANATTPKLVLAEWRNIGPDQKQVQYLPNPWQSFHSGRWCQNGKCKCSLLRIIGDGDLKKDDHESGRKDK